MSATKRTKGVLQTVSLLATGTQTTRAVPLNGRRLSVWTAWTGTPTGVLSLQTSYDGTTWVTVPGASVEFTENSQAQPAGGASQGVYNWSNVPGNMFRLSYAATSGTGTLTGYWETGD
jgi:hypothetical protein